MSHSAARRVLQVELVGCAWILFVGILAGCASSAPPASHRHKPIYVPSGWISDFSYEESLSDYLKAHAIIASSQSKHPMLYVFDDGWRSCQRFRRSANTERIADLFADKYVIMVSHDYLHRVLPLGQRSRRATIDRVGAIVPIDYEGNVTGPVIDHVVYDWATRKGQYRTLKQAFERLYGAE